VKNNEVEDGWIEIAVRKIEDFVVPRKGT